MARHRFGSHLRILQTLGTKDPSRLPFNNCSCIEADYQSGVEPPHSKGYADLIYAHTSVFYGVNFSGRLGGIALLVRARLPFHRNESVARRFL